MDTPSETGDIEDGVERANADVGRANDGAQPDGPDGEETIVVGQAGQVSQFGRHGSGQGDPAQTSGGARHGFVLSSLPDLRDTLSDEPSGDSGQGASRQEFTTVYDIIGNLENMLDNSKSGLFSPNMVKVDRESFIGQLNELKTMLPVQLERASALMREAERRLESAQSQANAVASTAQSRAADMIKDAQEQARFLAGQQNVTDLARQQARDILDKAQAKADRLTQGADEYCTRLMQGLQQQLGKLSQDVQAGLDVLDERRRAAAEDLPHIQNSDYPEG